MKGKLEVGPLRDLLAKLSEARRGDQWLTVHELSERTGVPYAVMSTKVLALIEQGWVEQRRHGDGFTYRASAEGQAKL